jgi:predicted methyltransferase
MVLACAGYASADNVPASVAAAISDPRRPPEQVRLDATRRPGLIVVFAQVKSGDRVAEFMPGNGYFTRILSDVVAPNGRVYAFNPQEQINNCAPSEIAGSLAIAHDPSYTNVTVLAGSLANFRIPEKLDLLWTAQNYHDLHDAFPGPVNVCAQQGVFSTH